MQYYLAIKKQQTLLKNKIFSAAKTRYAFVGFLASIPTGKLMTKSVTKLSANQVSDMRLKRMGFVFQQMYMLKNLSIYDNIVLPAYQSASGRDQRREINERAKVLMAKLGISEVADNDISEVSGGQLQRACIARSMINSPKIIFADETIVTLNKQISAARCGLGNMRKILRGIGRGSSITG